MCKERQQLEAGMAALEGQRALLGDVAVDAALAGLRSKLATLQPAPAASPADSTQQGPLAFQSGQARFELLLFFAHRR